MEMITVLQYDCQQTKQNKQVKVGDIISFRMNTDENSIEVLQSYINKSSLVKLARNISTEDYLTGRVLYMDNNTLTLDTSKDFNSEIITVEHYYMTDLEIVTL